MSEKSESAKTAAESQTTDQALERQGDDSPVADPMSVIDARLKQTEELVRQLAESARPKSGTTGQADPTEDELDMELGPKAAAIVRSLRKDVETLTLRQAESGFESAVNALADESVKSSVLKKAKVLEAGYRASGEQMPTHAELVREAMSIIASRNPKPAPNPVTRKPGAGGDLTGTPDDIRKRKFMQKGAEIAAAVAS